MNQKQDKTLLYKISEFIVDKRNLFFLLIGLLVVFSVVTKDWVYVENDLTNYLPASTAARQGLDVMNREFTTFGTADIMIANLTFAEAEEIAEEMRNMPGVKSVSFDNTSDHFQHASALYSVTFDTTKSDPVSEEMLDNLTAQYEDRDLYVSTAIGNQLIETLNHEVQIILVLAAIIITIILLLTSETYGEIPVLLITFVAAMLMNKGSNFLLGTISSVSNSVTSILQLALSLDYAVIFCNRYKEEHLTLPIREAVISALSKSIPEIAASSLTTIGGLFAMVFMQFQIGPDMGINLIKAIVFALFSVFVFMPGLLVVFGPIMEKTPHRNFLPDISFVGRFAYRTRKIIPVIFIGVVLVAAVISRSCPFVYGYDGIVTPKLNEHQIASQMIADTFTSSNTVALVVPNGNYEAEKRIMKELERREEVISTTGLANIEALDGHMLAERLNPRQFSELANVDYSVAQLAYTAYATEKEDYADIVTGISGYEVPLMDMFLFVCDEVEKGYIHLNEEQMELIDSAGEQIRSAKAQLQGPHYTRMLVELSLPASGDATYAFLDEILDITKPYYPGEEVYVVGDSTSRYDFKKSFSRDNVVVSIVSILIVLTVLLGTFKSVGMPVLLILVIQGAIWINFTIVTLLNKPVFFMSYLVVSAIQMGANIDYAIVISSRFMELKDRMEPKQAIIETMNYAFPTIIVSGAILAIAGSLIGQMTSEVSIVCIGQALGRGTIISIILVMFVLPQILLLGMPLIEKTSFARKRVQETAEEVQEVE